MTFQDNEVSQRLSEKQIEEERMRDVLLLLRHLTRQERVTITLILDCLYDIGSVNLINQKLHSRSLKGLAKWIARGSKPAFRLLALRWFEKNSPELIGRWLHKKVKFELPQPRRSVVVPATVTPDPIATNQREIQRLRTQVRYLQGVSVGAIAALVMVFLWIGLSPKGGPAQLIRQLPVTDSRTCPSLEASGEE